MISIESFYSEIVCRCHKYKKTSYNTELNRTLSKRSSVVLFFLFTISKIYFKAPLRNIIFFYGAKIYLKKYILN